MNIIDCTIKMRKEAQANYANLSLAAADKEVKRLFSLLAMAEDEHIDKLMTIRAEVAVSAITDEGFNGSLCVYRPNLKPVNLGKALRNDPDAYLHVMKAEEETIAFLDRLAAKTENPAMRTVCLAVAEKEREHQQMIGNIYAFVEEPRTYLEWGEFSNLGSL